VLIGPGRANDEKLAGALKALIGTIDAKTMREANLRVAGSGASPAEVARWLAHKIAK
jgi:glycine betaine/choline ABC-type transport system substrate-binding protein